MLAPALTVIQFSLGEAARAGREQNVVIYEVKLSKLKVLGVSRFCDSTEQSILFAFIIVQVGVS